LDIEENIQVLETAKELILLGLKSKDALHIACAIEGHCDYFLTTDDKVLSILKNYNKITVVNPLNIIVNLKE
jgi:predicted nucleic acid-binding protein